MVWFDGFHYLVKIFLSSQQRVGGHSVHFLMLLFSGPLLETVGALKGALDGGLDIPHSEKRFARYSKDGKQLDAEVHRKYIFGGHVVTYMKTLIEDEPEKYQSQFSEYIKNEINPDNIEEMYKNVHAAIRADLTLKKSAKPAPAEHKGYNLKRLTYEERKNKLIERLNALNSAVAAGDDSDEADK